jgi:hypothetical protein
VPLQFKDETGASEPEKELPWDRVDLSERWFDAVYGYLDSEWNLRFIPTTHIRARTLCPNGAGLFKG